MIFGKIEAGRTMQKRYIMLYKPYGVLSQFTGNEGQRTLAAFHLPPGVYAAGRLDKDSEGLLLLTDDGPFKNTLLHPRSGHSRTYWVQVEGQIDNSALQKLRKGLRIKGYQTLACKAKQIDTPTTLPERTPPVRFRKSIPTSWIEMTLTEGKNRQVRRMTAKVGFPTLRLVRISMENLHIADLQPGEWKVVQKKEIGP